jgi:hypothetical protein
MNRTPSTLIPLENVRVASPCRADWNLMEGDDRVRFCQSCTKNVYNLSALSKTEAEKLIAEKEGKLCVRFYQRADGTVLTDNCPVGLKTVRRPFLYLTAAFSALMASGAALFASGAGTQAPSAPTPNFNLRNIAFVNSIISRFDGSSTADSPVMGAVAPPIMGEIVCPQPTPQPTPPPAPKE